MCLFVEGASESWMMVMVMEDQATDESMSRLCRKMDIFE